MLITHWAVISNRFAVIEAAIRVGKLTRRSLVRVGLRLTPGEFSFDELSPERRDRLRELVLDRFKNDPSSAIHGATRWVLGRWTYDASFAAAHHADGADSHDDVARWRRGKRIGKSTRRAARQDHAAIRHGRTRCAAGASCRVLAAQHHSTTNRTPLLVLRLDGRRFSGGSLVSSDWLGTIARQRVL
jgi:hypothetical protein